MPSRLDPRGLVDLAADTVRSTAATTMKVAGWSERQALGLLRSRLESIVPSTQRGLPAERARSTGGLAERLDRLLDRAPEQEGTSGRQELFHKIVDQLVPDEARILAALSDGSASPLINVYRRTRAGQADTAVLENMTLVGRTADLALPQLTPTYVSHLLSLGLVEIDPEDTAMEAEYETLAADTGVLRAAKRAARGSTPARVDRRTLRLSGLGLELWSAATREPR